MIWKIRVITALVLVSLLLVRGAPCSPVSSTATAFPLKAPTDLTAIPYNESVNLTWTLNDPLATGYIILRRSQTGGPYTEIDRGQMSDLSGGGVHASDLDNGGGHGLKNGTAYYYVVVATGALGSSKCSAEAGTTPFLAVPDAPFALTAQEGDRAINLVWYDNSAADMYDIYRSRSGSGFVRIAHAEYLRYQDTKVTNGVEYSYYIKGCNAAGEGAPSEHVMARPFHALSTARQILIVAKAFCKAIGQPISAVSKIIFPSPLSDPGDKSSYWRPTWIVKWGEYSDVEVVDGSQLVCSYNNDVVATNPYVSGISIPRSSALKKFRTVLSASHMNIGDLGVTTATRTENDSSDPMSFPEWDVEAKRQYHGLTYHDQDAGLGVRADTGQIFSFSFIYPAPAPTSDAKRISGAEAAILAKAVLAKIGATDVKLMSTKLTVVEPNNAYNMHNRDDLETARGRPAKVAWDCCFGGNYRSKDVWIDAQDGSTLGGSSWIIAGG